MTSEWIGAGARGGRPTRWRGRVTRLLAVGAVVLAAMLVGTASASADVVWSVSSVHGDQHMAPGREGQYVVQAVNLGTTATSEPYTITDSLPAGVTVDSLAQIPSDVTNGGTWDCSATAFPDADTVTCSSSVSIGATSNSSRGYAEPLILNVDVPAIMGGTVANQVAVSGGSGTAVPVGATDMTVFSAVPAGFGVVAGSFAADAYDAQFPAGVPVRQAGAHPFEARVDFGLNLKLGNDVVNGGRPYTAPDEAARNLVTKLPAGLIGNPQAVPQCDPFLLSDPGAASFGSCPANTQVGSVDLVLQDGSPIAPPNATSDVSVFNMKPPPGVLAQLALTFVANPVFITITLDPSDHYSIIATIRDTTELLGLRGAQLTLWGVPGDPAHDALRVDPDVGFGTPFTGAPIKPFLALPFQCGVDAVTQMRADSWHHPGQYTPWQSSTPAQVSGCDDVRIRFEPSLRLQPSSRVASTPSGIGVDLTVPQKDDEVADAGDLYAGAGRDAALPTPPLRDAKVQLPAGVTVNPSSADGLGSCSPAQIGLGTDSKVACPPSSKIGTVQIDTPVLADALPGSVYLADQNDNPFNSLIALYIVARLPNGQEVKIPGRVDLDQDNGRLTATFDDNPQIPFSNLHLEFKSGPRAPLTTPGECGTYEVRSELSSWAHPDESVVSTSRFTIDEGCGPRGFAPGWSAGSVNPVAGGFSPFVASFSRDGHEQLFNDVSVDLPKGLVAKLKGVPLCGGTQADSGACPAGSRVGSATVGAGAGSNPFYLQDQPVYLTEGYKGAPYGLAVVVRAVAGPFDLGTVVVRQAIHIDPVTAELSVVSDPLPRILEGIPLNVRDVRVRVDRPEFAINPTSCAEKRVGATVSSTEGTVHRVDSRFQAADCASLGFKPKLAMRLTGKGRTRTGAHPGLKTVLTQGGGQANIARAQVALPKSVVLDPSNSTDPRLVCDYDKGQAADCPASSVIGKATARTPLLSKPLTGNVHLVQGIRIGSGGQRIRTLPTLLVKLRGEVAIDLRAKTSVRGNRLVTTFPTVPDARVSRFDLQINGGKKGILVITRTAKSNINICKAKQIAAVQTNGHNGRRSNFATTVKTPCAKKAKKAKRKKK